MIKFLSLPYDVGFLTFSDFIIAPPDIVISKAGLPLSYKKRLSREKPSQVHLKRKTRLARAFQSSVMSGS
jgi:hypothetical protein